MPYSVELKLIPLDDNPLPVSLGYNSYALFLNILRDSVPELAAELHQMDGPKPFTTAAVLPGYQQRKGTAPESSNQFLLRLTFLADEVFAHFLKSALEWGSKALQLGPAHFKVEQVNLVDVHQPHKNFCSYEELLSQATSERHVTLHFLTPTAFRSEGKRNVLFPEPGLVFGSLLNRWNTLSSVKLNSELQQCFSSQILLARYKLETRMLNFGNYQETGFIGKCSFILVNELSEQQSKTINALADFAFYSGIGAKTTMGMGQVRRMRNASVILNRARSNSEEGR